MINELPVRVYYEDTDAHGIVYHASYIRFCERGRTEFLRQAGFSNSALKAERGLIFVVRRLDAEYHMTAYLDDELAVRTSIQEMKNASFAMRQEIFRGGRMVFGMTVWLVCIGADEKPIRVPDDLRERWHTIGRRGAGARRSWLKRLARHNQRVEFERVITGRLPDNWHEAVIELKQRIADEKPRLSSRESIQKCLEALVPATPELIGGSAGLAGANLAGVKGQAPISAGNYGGRHIHYGVRKHGMAAAANGRMAVVWV